LTLEERERRRLTILATHDHRAALVGSQTLETRGLEPQTSRSDGSTDPRTQGTQNPDQIQCCRLKITGSRQDKHLN